LHERPGEDFSWPRDNLAEAPWLTLQQHSAVVDCRYSGGATVISVLFRQENARASSRLAGSPNDRKGLSLLLYLMTRPPLPPFTSETAAVKARLAEDAWNSRDPARVALAYTEGSQWRNRAEFLSGRAAIEAFLTSKWQREQDYRLIKEVWAFRENRIAVRFAYEWHDDSGRWFRSYGNENWEFDSDGLMATRIASINDLEIAESARKYHWPLGRRPDDHPSLSQLGL